ncbi:beta/gamma crystallin domain-containing protein [Nonomuraea sp. LPB2021202275-12-8]|uniref:beta/gamma crystallin domain-containing protein n=1 Tax=Nonomuraea sp. LPB2021202275-12-8 TaxID=3120159 RepID=UPI00300D51DF
MRKPFVSALLAAAISFGMVGASATPAAAINTVDCYGSMPWYEFAVVMGVDNWHCFANAGTVDVHIGWVSSLRAGNNVVLYDFTDRGGRGAITLQRGESYRFPDAADVTVTRIKIY